MHSEILQAKSNLCNIIFFPFIGTLYFTKDNSPFLSTKCRCEESIVIFNMMY